MKRPRCDNCGEKLYKIMEFSLGSKMISYCPFCGAKLLETKKRQLNEFSIQWFCILCIILILGVILILTSLSV